MQSSPNQNIQELARSAEIFTAAQKIGEEFSLHIDQVGELDAQIRQVLIGQADPKQFSHDISESLEIDDKLAEQITEKVSAEIFKVLKESVNESTTPADNTALEKVGGFEIEHDAVDKPDGTINKQEIMDQIEQDTPVVDHLRGNASSPAEKVETKGEPPPNLPAVEEKPQTAEPKNSGPDPYRETMI